MFSAIVEALRRSRADDRHHPHRAMPHVTTAVEALRPAGRTPHREPTGR
jgi:hypothetical protein